MILTTIKIFKFFDLKTTYYQKLKQQTTTLNSSGSYVDSLESILKNNENVVEMLNTHSVSSYNIEYQKRV